MVDLSTIDVSRFPHWLSPGGECLLVNGDCLEVMRWLPANIVESVVADPPYETTQNEWDVVIPITEMFERLDHICDRKSPIVLTSSQPFTSQLVFGRKDLFQYAMVWDKVNKYTDYLNAKRRPMKRHEDVLVFAFGTHTFNPKMVPVTAYKSRRSQPSRTKSYGRVDGCDYGKIVTEHNPCSVIEIEGNFTTGIVHPTQKPVALMQYLVESYSNQSELVLDFAMGSATTGIACFRAGRQFLGIELDAAHYATALKRCQAELSRFPLFEQPTKARQLGLLD